MKNTILVLFILGILIGCSQDDTSSTKDTSTKVPTEIIKHQDSFTFTTTITYTGNKLVEIKNSNGDYNRYTYNGDNIVKIISYEKDTDRDRTTLFEYKNGKISKQTYSSLDRGEPQSATYVNTTTYEWITNDHVKTTSKGSTGNYTLWQEYFFSNGNLTKNIYKTDHVSVPSKTYTTTYTYDKTNNPFKNVIGLEAILDTYRLGTNNVLQRDIVAESGSYYKHIYSYELDATRYPSKKTDTYYDNGVESSKPKDVILYKYRE